MALVCFICPTMMMIIHWWFPPPPRPPPPPPIHPAIVSKFSDQFAAAPVLKPSVVVFPKLFRSSLLPSFLIRTAHVAWLPAVATLQPLPLLLLLATVACCCWVLFLFLFVCLLVRFVGIVYICFERRRRVARKKERKKERRESCLLCCCGGCLLASFPGFRCLCSSAMI